jgi:hypothetical protein
VKKILKLNKNLNKDRVPEGKKCSKRKNEKPKRNKNIILNLKFN